MEKEMIGEEIYSLIYPKHKEDAGKLTGMLLDLPVPILVQMVQDQNMLTAAVEKASRALAQETLEGRTWTPQEGRSHEDITVTSKEDQEDTSTSSDSLGEQLFELVDVYNTGHSHKITGGLTKELQPLDINVNRPFKERLRAVCCCKADVRSRGYVNKTCALSSGMLLEQHKDVVRRLLSDSKLLEKQVNVALKTLTEMNQGEGDVSDSSEADEMDRLGEKLLSLVEEIDPHHANDITGMLLEMNPDTLHQLLGDHTMLTLAVQKAQAALNT